MVRKEEFSLAMFDTPGVRNLKIIGDEAKPVGVIVRDDELFLQVEITGYSEREHDIHVEIHGTGWPILNAEEVTYAGTGIVSGYVWHVFWTIVGSVSRTDERRIYTIYKYPVREDGAVEIDTDLRVVRELYREVQYGCLMAWVLLDTLQNR